MSGQAVAYKDWGQRWGCQQLLLDQWAEHLLWLLVVETVTFLGMLAHPEACPTMRIYPFWAGVAPQNISHHDSRGMSLSSEQRRGQLSFAPHWLFQKFQKWGWVHQHSWAPWTMWPEMFEMTGVSTICCLLQGPEARWRMGRERSTQKAGRGPASWSPSQEFSIFTNSQCLPSNLKSTSSNILLHF
jgi:hypothetical protein